MFDTAKTIIIALISGIITYFTPLGGEMLSLLVLFSINFLAGLLAALLSEHDSFQFKKAWKCIKEMTVFFLLIAAIYVIGEKKGNSAGAIQCVSFVSYAIIWFYSQNVLRNLKALFPDGTLAYRVLSFLYYVVSVEFIKKIPFLTSWNATNQKIRNDHD